MNAQQILDLPLDERVLVGYEIFAGGDVETMLELLADDVDVTVHGVRGGAASAHGAVPFLELLAELDAQHPVTSTPVDVAVGRARTFVLVDVAVDGGPRFQELHLFRHDDGGRVRELIVVPIDATITHALWP